MDSVKSSSVFELIRFKMHYSPNILMVKGAKVGYGPVYFGTAVVLFSVIEWIEIVREAVKILTVKSGRLKFRVG